MKKRNVALTIASFAAIVAFGTSAQAGDEVTLQQVPAPVKDTIQQHVQNGKLGSIEKEMEKDKPVVYEVEYTTADGKDFELTIAEDGKLLEKEED